MKQNQKQAQRRNGKKYSNGKSSGAPAHAPSRSKISPVLMQKVMQWAAYSIIATSVVLSWFKTPTPVAVGITVLAVLRVGIALREARREGARQQPHGICSAQR